MEGNRAVVGVFGYVDDMIAAIHAIKDSHDYRVYSPTYNHELDELTMPGKSPVRRVTMTGAVIGLISGFTLAILCSMDWPLRVSAKDIVAIPAFVVVGYECTILFGALATLLAIFHFCRLPDVLRKAGYDPRFSDNKFGLVVGCGSEDADKVSNALSSAGAEEVEVRDAL